ncbi:uncharacterized protein LOC114357690 [Ostrinia furnacalis]|uniref:uncharacterized protein LOC114357690 n=1 Tax=Ostrinia furnacalis TaxID=93504 RepID=UPI0010394B51|nr:uncharacterized protein LOC114357690 [Ostrinia furnacalis]
MMKLVVLSCLMAAASAGIISAYSPYAAYGAIAYSAPIIAPNNYRGPLSLAPGQPANLLGADGRPLDTLDVNLDRAAHYNTKAFGGIHLLKKRSAPLIAAVAPVAPVARVALSSPVIASAPIAYSTPIGTPYGAYYGSHLTYAAPYLHY